MENSTENEQSKRVVFTIDGNKVNYRGLKVLISWIKNNYNKQKNIKENYSNARGDKRVVSVLISGTVYW